MSDDKPDRPVAIVNQYPTLVVIRDEMESIRRQEEERLVFLKKQVDDLHVQQKAKASVIWEKFDAELKSLGLVDKDYDPKSGKSFYRYEGGIIHIASSRHNRDCHCAKCLLKAILE